jgi:hypothetical protein
VLLDGRRRDLGLKILDEGGDMERLHRREFIDGLAGAPGGEAPGGVHIGAAGMIVVDLSCEKFQNALCGLRRGAKNGASWRSGEGARMISVVISRISSDPLAGRQACDKGRYHTLNRKWADESSGPKPNRFG